jgi:hypothetical protein
LHIHTRLSEHANAFSLQQFARLLDFTQIPKVATTEFANCLSAQYLNQLKDVFAPSIDYSFINQDSMKDSRYYEQIIFQDKLIPTRTGSLHDYFNGLIWLQFAHTKAYLNQLHWQDIKAQGLQRRSAVRDRITHFDECGIVLVSDLPELRERLAAHDWQWLFVENRPRWFQSRRGIVPLHFGHANLEMLCNPFIGLTAKALVIESPKLLLAANELHSGLGDTDSDRLGQTRIDIDRSLQDILHNQMIFDQKRAMLPLPILGIPRWHNQAQDSAFYGNANYFMPHPNNR